MYVCKKWDKICINWFMLHLEHGIGCYGWWYWKQWNFVNKW